MDLHMLEPAAACVRSFWGEGVHVCVYGFMPEYNLLQILKQKRYCMYIADPI